MRAVGWCAGGSTRTLGGWRKCCLIDCFMHQTSTHGRAATITTPEWCYPLAPCSHCSTFRSSGTVTKRLRRGCPSTACDLCPFPVVSPTQNTSPGCSVMLPAPGAEAVTRTAASRLTINWRRGALCQSYLSVGTQASQRSVSTYDLYPPPPVAVCAQHRRSARRQQLQCIAPACVQGWRTHSCLVFGGTGARMRGTASTARQGCWGPCLLLKPRECAAPGSTSLRSHPQQWPEPPTRRQCPVVASRLRGVARTARPARTVRCSMVTAAGYHVATPL